VVIARKESAAAPAPRVALLAGASGLTGSALLGHLLRDEAFTRVIALSRRPLPVEHARLANRILPRFGEMLEQALKSLRCTDAFCTLGAAGGPRAAEADLRAVALDLVLAFAKAARAAGATRFVVVSAAGAAREAATAFLRVKAEMEGALREVGFTALDILQPGHVVGVRDGDGTRELLRQGLLAAASPLMRRSRGALNAVTGKDLAAAMAGIARAQRLGVRTYSGEAITSAARHLLRPAP
jgi:uncharacterized protein YbjT (DUF2867 family)